MKSKFKEQRELKTLLHKYKESGKEKVFNEILEQKQVKGVIGGVVKKWTGTESGESLERAAKTGVWEAIEKVDLSRSEGEICAYFGDYILGEFKKGFPKIKDFLDKKPQLLSLSEKVTPEGSTWEEILAGPANPPPESPEEEIKNVLKAMFEKQRQIVELLMKSEISLTQQEIATGTNSSEYEVTSVLNMFYRLYAPNGKEIRTCKILLIEDDESLVKSLKKKFEKRFQAEVELAYTSNEAHEILNNKEGMKKVNLVILDMMLPKNKGNLAEQKEGEKLLEKIAKNYYPQIPLLVFSSLLNISENPKKYTRDGITNLLHKIQSWGTLRAFSKEGMDYEYLLNTMTFLLSYKGEEVEEEKELKYEMSNGTLLIEDNRVFWLYLNKQKKEEICFEPRQLKILKILVKKQGKTVGYEVFGRIISGNFKENLKTQISGIRKKLKSFPIDIKAKSGEGYFLSSPTNTP